MGLIMKHKKLAGIIVFFMTMLFFLLLWLPVYAASRMTVAETYTGESEVVLYVKGVNGELSDIRVQAGTADCDSVVQTRLLESSQTIKTLIMLDNSLSIPQADRKRIFKILRNIISDRMEQEEIALAAFNDGIGYLADYTTDNQVLLEAAKSIEYQSSHTYLTDVLYDLLSAEYVQNKEDMFWRIVVISDGMDNKSIGYTKDELFALLKEHPVPIYTIGVQTSRKDNNEQLENMFAISRVTGADSFLLGDSKDMLDIEQALWEVRNIVRLAVRPPEDLMDGSRKTVKITFSDGESISAEAVMPQQVKAAETQTSQAETADEETTETSADKGMTIILILSGLLVIAAAVIAVALIFIKKKKKDTDGDEKKETDHSQTVFFEDSSETEILQETEQDDGDRTVMMWNTEASCHMILTDVSCPGRTFQIPLRNSVVIGRKQGACGITIDYDRSVSGRHCEIKIRNGRFFISDLQSSNGTYVDGSRVTEEMEIASGSMIRLGKLELKFEIR